jgi:hypothetical protein
MRESKLYCTHFPKKFRLVYSCKITGNYTLEICESCHKKEDRKFLISEEKIPQSDYQKEAKNIA